MEERLSQSEVYNDPHAIWSSRGIYDSKKEQNSLSSFGRAFDAGYLGVEVDCYYDKGLNQFIVSHDRNKTNPDGSHFELKDGKLLTLEVLFNTLGKDHYFWIVYKNLDHLNEEESLASIRRLDSISQIHHVKSRLYIEGSTPNHLEYYTHAGYKTLFAFGPLRDNHIFSSISSNIYKIAYYFYDLSAIAIHYGSIDNPKYGKDSQKNLKGIPTFLFHVPDDEILIKTLLEKSELRVLLVGRNISVDRAGLTR
jgi:hypothetical protein